MGFWCITGLMPCLHSCEQSKSPEPYMASVDCELYSVEFSSRFPYDLSPEKVIILSDRHFKFKCLACLEFAKEWAEISARKFPPTTKSVNASVVMKLGSHLYAFDQSAKYGFIDGIPVEYDGAVSVWFAKFIQPMVK